ncbi:MAG TPA: type II toxin-antitoxin system ParD family antitoxin [Gemmataceae bacterium]|nr:type II toxin-antitoxin system ParD family antitoxin [Gemmataceae bacterium]
MASDLHLTPHLEAFISAQLLAGRFQSRDDVISAALSLLEQTSASADAAESRPTNYTKARERISPNPNASLPALETPLISRRSPRGLLADIPSNIDPDDIKLARREMWSGYLTGPVE